MDPYKRLYGRIMLTIGTLTGGTVVEALGPYGFLGAVIFCLAITVAAYRRV
jgi:hypothetical protein